MSNGSNKYIDKCAQLIEIVEVDLFTRVMSEGKTEREKRSHQIDIA